MSQLSVELRHAKRSNLTQIDLSERFLASLPKELYSIQSLLHLNLNRNNISHIDSSIAQLQKLQTLLLENNDLAQLPKEILKLKELTLFQIKGNPLTGKFTSLLVLDNCCQQMNTLRNCFESFENRIAATPSWLLQHPQKEVQKEKDYLTQKLKISPKKKIIQRRPIVIKNQPILESQRQSKNGALVVNTKDLELYKEVNKSQYYSLYTGEYCGLQVNIKIFSKTDEQSLNTFKNEQKLMTIYRHPNIAAFIGVCQEDLPQIITQRLSKSLGERLISSQQSLSNELRTKVIFQLVSAVNFLHNHGVIHGGISLFSVFLDSNENLKLTNFQFAHHQSQRFLSKKGTRKGLELYLPPQCRQMEISNQQSDIFALGTLIYELYTRPLASQAPEISQFFNNPHNKELLPRHPKIKQQIWQKIKNCRNKQPSQRPSCSQLSKFKGW